MRSIVIGAVLALLLGGTAFAQSKCDSGVVKATGKKASCECGAIAKAIKKNTTPDFTKCTEKFDSACNKAKSNADCVVQVKSCAAKEAEVDQFVTDHCVGSPSGAFLE